MIYWAIVIAKKSSPSLSSCLLEASIYMSTQIVHSYHYLATEVEMVLTFRQTEHRSGV